MNYNDKDGLLKKFNKDNFHSIELGCGNKKRISEAIGIDLIDHDSVDIVGDAIEIMHDIPDNSIDLIYSHHFMEHIKNLDLLIYQISRVLKPGGKCQTVVPHFSNPFFYSDPTHHVFFGLYTFGYYAEVPMFRRTIPTYRRIEHLQITEIKLVFKSYPPHYIRHGFKKIMEAIFNINTYLKEYYEENLSGILPCYEISCIITKVKKDD
jgi:ubiquinone/menaquinone biosynthesis C-methylase UbiE